MTFDVAHVSYIAFGKQIKGKTSDGYEIDRYPWVKHFVVDTTGELCKVEIATYRETSTMWMPTSNKIDQNQRSLITEALGNTFFELPDTHASCQLAALVRGLNLRQRDNGVDYVVPRVMPKCGTDHFKRCNGDVFSVDGLMDIRNPPAKETDSGFIDIPKQWVGTVLPPRRLHRSDLDAVLTLPLTGKKVPFSLLEMPKPRKRMSNHEIGSLVASMKALFEKTPKILEVNKISEPEIRYSDIDSLTEFEEPANTKKQPMNTERRATLVKKAYHDPFGIVVECQTLVDSVVSYDTVHCFYHHVPIKADVCVIQALISAAQCGTIDPCIAKALYVNTTTSMVMHSSGRKPDSFSGQRLDELVSESSRASTPSQDKQDMTEITEDKKPEKKTLRIDFFLTHVRLCVDNRPVQIVPRRTSVGIDAETYGALVNRYLAGNFIPPAVLEIYLQTSQSAGTSTYDVWFGRYCPDKRFVRLDEITHWADGTPIKEQAKTYVSLPSGMTVTINREPLVRDFDGDSMTTSILDYPPRQRKLPVNNQPSTPKEEKTMDLKTLAILQKLANVNQHTDEFAALGDAGCVNADLRTALADLRAKEHKAATVEAAQVVLDQLKLSSTQIDVYRRHLAEVRRQEKIYIARIEHLAVAAEYGRETTNYVPLAVLLSKDGNINLVDPEDCVPKADYDRLLKVIRERLRSAAGTEKANKAEPTGRRTKASSAT